MPTFSGTEAACKDPTHAVRTDESDKAGQLVFASDKGLSIHPLRSSESDATIQCVAPRLALAAETPGVGQMK